MLNRFTYVLLSVLLCVGSSALAQTTRPASKEEETQIRDAVRGFLLGLARGNPAEAHRHACSDEITSTMIDAVIPLIKAADKMEGAATKAFGQAGGVFGGQNPLQAFNQFARRVDDGEIQVKGIYAVLLPVAPTTQPTDADGNPIPRRQRTTNYNNGLYLKRESDAWRVDLSEMPNAQQFAQMAPMLHVVTDAMNSIADELVAGEYENAQEVQQALRQRIIQGVFQAQQGQ